MATTANEEKFEELIEKFLLEQGFYKGSNKDFDKKYAIDTKRFYKIL
jgi:predicted transcriptional regulator